MDTTATATTPTAIAAGTVIAGATAEAITNNQQRLESRPDFIGSSRTSSGSATLMRTFKVPNRWYPLRILKTFPA